MLQEGAAKPPAPVVKYAYSDARLEKIKTAIALSETVRALLDFAATENIRIEMSNSKVMDDDPKDSLTIKGLNYSTLIRLNGDISSDDEVMITLAHELRHSWHERRIHLRRPCALAAQRVAEAPHTGSGLLRL